MANSNSKIILALDFKTETAVFNLVDQLQADQCRLKVGKELFTRCGPDIVRKLVKQGFDVFLDLKYHDIPNTVAQACLAASDLGVWMLNVHAMGGQRMLASARDALSNVNNSPLLIAVTVLTSMDDQDLQQLGISETASETAIKLAALAKREGLDGVVCSAMEAQSMREQLGSDFYLVTPGIRTADDAKDDQRRIMTPEAAIKAGSNYLVMGRAITKAKDPMQKLSTINQAISTL